jgi:hypothetical protein
MVLRIGHNSVLVGFFFKIILNIFATGLPVLPTFPTSYIWSHSSLIERISLEKSVDIKPDFCLLDVPNGKVIPLHVTVCVGINSHVQIVFLGGNPQIYPQIPNKP